MSSRLRSAPSSRGMVPVRRFRARDLREHERQSGAPSRANAAPRTHRESKLPREPTIEGIVPVRLFCWSHRCSRLFNKPSSSGMQPVILLSWMSLPQEENNEHTRAQESERECSHRVFRSEHLAIAAGMVPVSSAFVRLIVVHVQAPRGLKHARPLRSSSTVVATAREQTTSSSKGNRGIRGSGNSSSFLAANPLVRR